MARTPTPSDHPLHRAVRWQSLSTLRRHLAAGADPRAKDVRGLRPLDALSMELPDSQDLVIAEELINAMGPTWWRVAKRALWIAVENDNLDLVRLFIGRGYRLGYRAHLLHRAVRLDRVAVLPLLTSPQNVNRLDDDGLAPLHHAQSADAVGTLVDLGGDVHRRSRGGQTPLHRAPTAEVAAALLSRGAEVDAQDRRRQTPLHLAADRGVAKALLDAGAQIDAQTKAGVTPLLRHTRDDGIRRLLLRAGADPDAVDRFGTTPILLAARLGNHRAAHELLAAGADPSVKDRRGRGLGACLAPWGAHIRERVYTEVLSAAPDYLTGLDDRARLDDALVRALQGLASTGSLQLTATQASALLASGGAALRNAVLRLLPRVHTPDPA